MTAIPKPKRERDEAYLAWIRTLPCLVCGGTLSVDAHHVREKGKGGTGTKPSDRRTVPLCREAHSSYHDIGRVRFEATFRLNLEAQILRLNAYYAKLQKPAVKKRTIQRMKVALSIQRCLECGHSHEIPLQKVQKGRTWKFRCIRTNQFIEVA